MRLNALTRTLSHIDPEALRTHPDASRANCELSRVSGTLSYTCNNGCDDRHMLGEPYKC